MTDLLHIDFETASLLDLNVYGTDRYATDHSTKVLMEAWAINDGPVQLWQPHLNSQPPKELSEAIADPDVRIVSWHSQFERNIYQWVLNTEIPAKRFIDPMILARFLSLPGGLDNVSEILGLNTEGKFVSKASQVYANKFKKLSKKEAQTRISTYLINKFTLPVTMGGELTLFGISEPYFRSWESDPDDWELFGEYCKQDVVAERAVLHALRKFPLPQDEFETWVLDQEINDRGIPVDIELVNNAAALAEQIQTELKDKLKKLTKLENPNSRDQILEWAKERGYPFNVMGKAFVNIALTGNFDMTDECRKALAWRKQTAKTGTVKFTAIKNMVGTDGRLRNSFSFMGAARTGRWAGKDVQMQNLVRPEKEVKDNLAKAIEIVRSGDVNLLKSSFKTEPLDVLGSCIRSAFKAAPGNKLVICDLGAIENRGLGWTTKCDKILKVFRDGLDPYVSFAVYLYNEPYEKLIKDKEKRQNAKPAVLGAGYGLGGGSEVETKDGDIVKTGLWGYAENMGIKISQELAHESVRIFREQYKDVVEYWYKLGDAAIRCVKSHRPEQVDFLRFDMHEGVLRMILPSGRPLHYIEPKVEEKEIFGKLRETLTYMGMDQKLHVWTRVPTWGGKLIENYVQAISRDLLVYGMKNAKAMGFDIVIHCHDEIVAEVGVNSSLGIKQLRECMIETPKWAPGFPIDAAGFESDVYRKE